MVDDVAGFHVRAPTRHGRRLGGVIGIGVLALGHGHRIHVADDTGHGRAMQQFPEWGDFGILISMKSICG
jgi:hypothetical protein